MSSPKPFPNATIEFKPFKIAHSPSEVNDLKTLLRLSPLGQAQFENSSAREGKYGVSLEWMEGMKREWMDFDWSTAQDKLNSYPHYIAQVDGHQVHFIGYYNADPTAVPLVLLHGWPGCFMEFLELIPILQAASSQPLHIIIPSHLGYTYSSAAPMDREFGMVDMASLMDELMIGLGFGGGYVVQGGDIGSHVGRLMAFHHESCKAIHLNFAVSSEAPSKRDRTYVFTEKDKHALARKDKFSLTGRGYAIEHNTRPATIGFVVGSSPVALLAWIGEKLLEWTDPATIPSTNHILTWLTLYYLTDTFRRSIYPYRHEDIPRADASELYITKPLGFSSFPFELMPMPQGYAAGVGNLVVYREHDKGGHFAATEQPDVLGEDILEFLRIVRDKINLGN